MVRNIVLQGCEKNVISDRISDDIPPKMKFEYNYPHSNAFLQFLIKLERCKENKGAHHPTKCDVINDVILFLTVYRRIYCRKLLTSSNLTSHYKSKCIRVMHDKSCLNPLIINPFNPNGLASPFQ